MFWIRTRPIFYPFLRLVLLCSPLAKSKSKETKSQTNLRSIDHWKYVLTCFVVIFSDKCDLERNLFTPSSPLINTASASPLSYCLRLHKCLHMQNTNINEQTDKISRWCFLTNLILEFVYPRLTPFTVLNIMLTPPHNMFCLCLPPSSGVRKLCSFEQVHLFIFFIAATGHFWKSYYIHVYFEEWTFPNLPFFISPQMQFVQLSYVGEHPNTAFVCRPSWLVHTTLFSKQLHLHSILWMY